MKLIKCSLLCYFFYLPQWVVGQQTDTNLYIRLSEDGEKVGIQHGNGTIIVPMIYTNIYGYTDGDTVKDEVIEFYSSDKVINDQLAKENPNVTIGTVVFDREGRILYYPLWFDNGSDYFVEGKRRIVDVHTGKVGFVNQHHQVIIAPQWEYVSPFNYGYALVYKSYHFVYIDSFKEHTQLVPKNSQSKTFLVNTNGAKVIGYAAPKHLNDYWNDDDSLYYPYPFVYTSKEKNIVDSLNRHEVLFLLYLRNHYPSKIAIDHRYRYEMLDRDTLNGIYYFQMYANQYGVESQQVRYLERTQQYEVLGWNEGAETWMPLVAYILKELDNAASFFSKNKAAPNYFDVTQMTQLYRSYNNAKK